MSVGEEMRLSQKRSACIKGHIVNAGNQRTGLPLDNLKIVIYVTIGVVCLGSWLPPESTSQPKS